MNNKIDELIKNITSLSRSNEKREKIKKDIELIFNKNPYEFLNEYLLIFCAYVMTDQIYKFICLRYKTYKSSHECNICRNICTNFKLTEYTYRDIPIFSTLFEKYNKRIILSFGIIV